MTPETRLEETLRRVTRWDESAPELWARALAARQPSEKSARRPDGNLLNRRIPMRMLLPLGTAAAVLAFAVLIANVFIPSLRVARSARSNAESPLESRASALRQFANDNTEWFTQGRFLSPSSGDKLDVALLGGAPPPGFTLRGPDSGEAFREATVAAGRASGGFVPGPDAATTASPQPTAPPPSEPRHVIQKGTIELETKDVSAAFLKVAMLVSAADGEYVQESALQGQGAAAAGNLTLRVAAGRLSRVLSELRQLGVVRSEKLEGQDVTTQVVDIESRLRNEQRVEKELLELLETRKQSPLKDVLELRNAIAQVRTTIEQLTGQRERLAHLTALATVLVIIRAADAPAAPPPAGVGAYFFNGLGRAWRVSLEALSDSVAFLLQLLVGGLIWWAALAAAFVVVRHHVRRAREAAAYR